MRKLRLVAAIAVAAGVLAACKGDTRLTTFVTSPDAGSAEGYVGGTPITLVDGTPVTLPDGTPVTSPKIKGKPTADGENSGSGADDIQNSDVATPVGGGSSNNGGSNTPTTLLTTGTTSVTSRPNVNKLARPRGGTYRFHETIVPDDGGSGVDADVFIKYVVDASETVKIQRANDVGEPIAPDYYAESYTTAGLFLVDSALYGDPCVWSPRAVSLPQSVIDGGPKVSTSSTCTTTINGNSATFKLDVTIGFKRLKTVRIGNKDYAAIDVERHRVLSRGKEKITADAIDTYVFDLGIRVATSEHTTSEDGERVRATTRNQVLLAVPA